MKIFVSYARIDKPFCIQLVNTLGAHDVWYDQRLYAGKHWWKEIVRRLEWCNLFIYLLSKDSIASTYCRQELEIARKLGREIIPVLIDATAELPDDLKDVHYVDMTEALDHENVALLHNSILLVERELNGRGATQVKKVATKLKTDELQPPMEKSAEIISQAAKAFASGDYDKTMMLVNQAKAMGFQSEFVNLDKLYNAAKAALAKIRKQRAAERDYRFILPFFEQPETYQFGCEYLKKFQAVYPDYDPKGLKRLCRQVDNIEPKRPRILDEEILPMLKWCEIPKGMVRVANTGSHEGGIPDEVVRVSDFLISKYPVTNAQYQAFLEAEDGYYNKRWWTFSDYARIWFEQHPQALPSKYEGDMRPRENINWYEAMAFCRWLSHCSGYNIMLPRIYHWQRAAQGDDDRIYPWGNIFHDGICNTYESGIKTTTEVNRYDTGVSPYGVYDLSGNTWEWCLDQAEPEEGLYDYRRAVIGGSFVSPADRAQISFRYYLKPEARYSSIGFRLVCLPNSENITY